MKGYTVKAFRPGLVCTLGRGEYQYHEGLNLCPDAYANCRENGFHSCEEPFNCLSYYAWDGKNEFWLCRPGGDIDEDGSDSKVSSTELTLVDWLDEQTFLALEYQWMKEHPTRSWTKPEGKSPFTVRRGWEPRGTVEAGKWLMLVEEQDGLPAHYTILNGRVSQSGGWMLKEGVLIHD